MDTKIKIVTHNGKFHLDDVFGVATLLLLLGKEKCEVVRVGHTGELPVADYMLDIGMEDDPDTNRFDHHQPAGAGVRENGVPYASFGLIWKKFGKELCGSQEVTDALDRSLVQPIDGPDNGVSMYTPLYEGVSPYTLGNLIYQLRPTWKEDFDYDEQFTKAVAMAQEILAREIQIQQDIHEATQHIVAAYERAEDKRLVIVDGKHSFGRELVTRVLEQYEEILFVLIFRKDRDNWQLVGPRVSPGNHAPRKALPQAWRGLRNEELQKVTGVSDAVFCHRSGFMCVASSKEGALQLAQYALKD